MTNSTYAAPRITAVGSLHDLTLDTYKNFGGADGVIFAPTNTPMGTSDKFGNLSNPSLSPRKA